MSWTSEIKYKLAGSITTGLTLDETNPESGSIPSGFMTYGDDNYGDSNYEPTAIFQGVYSNLPGAYKEFVFDYSCGAGDIFYQYQVSEAGSTGSWSSAIDVSVDNDLTVKAPYCRFRFIWYSPLWTDADEVLVDSITEKFIVFAAGETISALEINSNYGFVAQGDMLPRGGNSMEATNLVYDLGSDIRAFEDVYINNLNMSGSLYDGLNLVASVTLSAATDRIEFTGLSGDADELYIVNAQIVPNAGSIGADTIYCKMFFNGDSSSATYGEQQTYNQNGVGVFGRYYPSATWSTSGLYISRANTVTSGYIQAAFTEVYISTKTGLPRIGTKQQLMQGIGQAVSEVIAEQCDAGFIWNNTADTLTAIQFKMLYRSNTDTSIDFAVGTHIEIWTKKVAT